MNIETKSLKPVKHYLKTKHWRNAYDKIPETHRVYSNIISIMTIRDLCYDIQNAVYVLELLNHD